MLLLSYSVSSSEMRVVRRYIICLPYIFPRFSSPIFLPCLVRNYISILDSFHCWNKMTQVQIMYEMYLTQQKKRKIKYTEATLCNMGLFPFDSTEVELLKMRRGIRETWSFFIVHAAGCLFWFTWWQKLCDIFLMLDTFSLPSLPIFTIVSPLTLMHQFSSKRMIVHHRNLI